ncbi:hypothetical protein, partial [Klebsiella michiganensis]|uniref:hypothetical protein n=1 Tax=Klebsiella michiganensis TaxID=1134687 RepID=UPI001CCAE0A4
LAPLILKSFPAISKLPMGEESKRQNYNSEAVQLFFNIPRQADQATTLTLLTRGGQYERQR